MREWSEDPSAQPPLETLTGEKALAYMSFEAGRRAAVNKLVAVHRQQNKQPRET